MQIISNFEKHSEEKFWKISKFESFDLGISVERREADFETQREAKLYRM